MGGYDEIPKATMLYNVEYTKLLLFMPLRYISKMKCKLTVIIFLVCATFQLKALAAKPLATPIRTVDSLLTVYSSAKRNNRTAIGGKLIQLCMVKDNLISLHPKVADLPDDSLDFYVWFAAERFYYINSYFKESLSMIDKALPLASDNAPEYHATLLCDRGYCLFKTSRNTQATNAILEAERFSKKHGLMLPLARAYNYLAIINISLGFLDEAKHFVQKAIETDRLTGSNKNTHNYLGIACEVYNVAKEPEKAIRYGHEAVEAARAINYDEGVVNHLSQLSYAYNRNGDFEQALALSLEAVRTVEQMEVVDRNLLAISLEYVTNNLLDMKRNSEAVPYIRRAISLEEELGNYRSVCYDHLSLAEALEEDHPHESNKALHRYATMLDSLHHVEMHEALSNANATLHNDELQEENILSKQRERLIIFASIAGILLLSTIIAILTYINRLRKRAQLATERLNIKREAFYTNITHEFRTPLTVILGLTRQLEKKESDPKTKKSLETIERNGQSLLTLVNQLLDISKITSGFNQFSWQEGDVAAYVEMIAEGFRPMADMGGIDLHFRGPSHSINTFFVADAMQKMVGNLLSNAMKYTPQGGKVTVTVESDGKTLQISVTDNGIGIQPEDIDSLFEPFFQGSNHNRTGTGVGLALVNQLSKTLGGQIEAKSTPGVETVFTITLPLKDSLSKNDHLAAATGFSDDWQPTVVQQAERPTETVSEDDSAKDGRTRILVVEDNADVASFIGSVLEERYAVDYASNGAEGERKAAEWMPDLIVTDVMMPEIDGMEMCRRIRSSEQTNHIPIIIITARTTDKDRLSGLEAGAEAYLNKPFLVEELLLHVENILEQRRLLQQKFLRSIEQEVVAPTEQDAATDGAVPDTQDASIYERHLSETNSAFLRKLDDAILRLMHENQLNVQNVAAAVFLSRSQFGRKLRAIVDISPSDYINDVRLNEVKRLLHSKPMPTLLDIALLTGYSDHSHLSHAFRRKYGVSPSQYIRQNSDAPSSTLTPPE